MFFECKGVLSTKPMEREKPKEIQGLRKTLTPQASFLEDKITDLTEMIVSFHAYNHYTYCMCSDEHVPGQQGAHSLNKHDKVDHIEPA